MFLWVVLPVYVTRVVFLPSLVGSRSRSLWFRSVSTTWHLWLGLVTGVDDVLKHEPVKAWMHGYWQCVVLKTSSLPQAYGLFLNLRTCM